MTVQALKYHLRTYWGRTVWGRGHAVGTRHLCQYYGGIPAHSHLQLVHGGTYIVSIPSLSYLTGGGIPKLALRGRGFI